MPLRLVRRARTGTGCTVCRRCYDRADAERGPAHQRSGTFKLSCAASRSAAGALFMPHGQRFLNPQPVVPGSHAPARPHPPDLGAFISLVSGISPAPHPQSLNGLEIVRCISRRGDTSMREVSRARIIFFNFGPTCARTQARIANGADGRAQFAASADNGGTHISSAAAGML